MAYLQQLHAGYRSIGRLRPEEKAVPSTQYRPLLGRFAGAESGEISRGLQRGTRRLRSESTLRNIKRNIRSARRDAPWATAIGIGDVALRAREAKTEAKRAEEYEIQMKELRDKIADMGMLYDRNLEEYRKILSGESTIEIPDEVQP